MMTAVAAKRLCCFFSPTDTPALLSLPILSLSFLQPPPSLHTDHSNRWLLLFFSDDPVCLAFADMDHVIVVDVSAKNRMGSSTHGTLSYYDL